MGTDRALQSNEARAQNQPRLTIAGTALITSRVGLGTHSLHRLATSRSRQRQLALAYDLGVRYFDTAPSYGAGRTERELGRFARGRRSDLVLTTKFGINSGLLAAHVPGWLYAQMALRAVGKLSGTQRMFASSPKRGYSAANVRASVEKSLRALGTDHIDILYLHEPQLELLEGDSLLQSLEALKAAGKVRHFGLSGQSANSVTIAMQHPTLAHILQLEMPGGNPGAPLPDATEPQAAVRFWELGRQTTSQLAQGVEWLRAATPRGVIMISTNSAVQLRETAGRIEESDSAASGSATSALA